MSDAARCKLTWPAPLQHNDSCMRAATKSEYHPVAYRESAVVTRSSAALAEPTAGSVRRLLSVPLAREALWRCEGDSCSGAGLPKALPLCGPLLPLAAAPAEGESRFSVWQEV